MRGLLYYILIFTFLASAFNCKADRYYNPPKFSYSSFWKKKSKPQKRGDEWGVPESELAEVIVIGEEPSIETQVTICEYNDYDGEYFCYDL